MSVHGHYSGVLLHSLTHPSPSHTTSSLASCTLVSTTVSAPPTVHLASHSPSSLRAFNCSSPFSLSNHRYTLHGVLRFPIRPPPLLLFPSSPLDPVCHHPPPVLPFTTVNVPIKVKTVTPEIRLLVTGVSLTPRSPPLTHLPTCVRVSPVSPQCRRPPLLR